MDYVISIAAIVLVVGASALVRRTIVYEWEAGLKYVRGRFGRVLTPGAHWYCWYTTRIVRIDLRPHSVTVPGQEVLSSDNISLRVSIAATYRVSDPQVAVNDVGNYAEALYLKLQVALREIIGGAEIDDFLARRAEFSRQLAELTAGPVSELGLELVSADIKDIMFPGALKEVFALVAKARKEGQAALERARGETAALRNLANAARLLERNPALMQLRVVQSVEGSRGSTVVLGMPAQAMPLPVQTDKVEPPDGNPPSASAE
jgi:regulator of protease activity HflC (stomatin/prohibitin superfamily)